MNVTYILLPYLHYHVSIIKEGFAPRHRKDFLMEHPIIYIGDIAAEAYGYGHLVGTKGTLYKLHPALPLASVDIEGEPDLRWISTADCIQQGDFCTL